jgi:hypothetical protein
MGDNETPPPQSDRRGGMMNGPENRSSPGQVAGASGRGKWPGQVAGSRGNMRASSQRSPDFISRIIAGFT